MPWLVSLLSTTTTTSVSWVRHRFWLLRLLPLAARVTHAPLGKVLTPPSAIGPLLCLFLYFWAYLLFLSSLIHLCNSVWVLMTQYTFQITFTYVAFVPRAKRHPSSEVLPLRTFILKFVFALPSPFVFLFLL
jgi:hypothetical protein